MTAGGEAPPPTNCDLPDWCERFAIISILNQRLDSRVFYPKYYLGATHEVFGVTLIFTWLISLIFTPDQVFKHPAKVIIGSYNPCFGWDYPPTSYIALSLCAFNVYFAWRYVWLKLTRSSLLNEPVTIATRFNTFASYCLAISSNLWLILWLVGPNKDEPDDPDGPVVVWWAAHTGIFVFYAASAYGAYVGNVWDIADGPRRNAVERRHIIFSVVYGVAVGYLVFVYGYSLVKFENGEPPALGNGVPTQVADIIWMACVSCVTSFMPKEPPLEMKTRVVTEEFDNQEEGGSRVAPEEGQADNKVQGGSRVAPAERQADNKVEGGSRVVPEPAEGQAAGGEGEGSGAP